MPIVTQKPVKQYVTANFLMKFKVPYFFRKTVKKLVGIAWRTVRKFLFVKSVREKCGSTASEEHSSSEHIERSISEHSLNKYNRSDAGSIPDRSMDLER